MRPGLSRTVVDEDAEVGRILEEPIYHTGSYLKRPVRWVTVLSRDVVGRWPEPRVGFSTLGPLATVEARRTLLDSLGTLKEVCQDS